MKLHRIEHAIVMDTDDVPGRGGYAVVGISPRVSPAERSFIAGNFGISDYLHDPKTANRILYSVFRVPGGRRAFVRRFARGDELRRNNTQRRLIVHTMLLDDRVWAELKALPWLLLNANVRIEGTTAWELLRADVPWVEDGSVLPALEWDSDDGSTSKAWQSLANRLTVVGSQLGEHGPEPRSLLTRVITALAARNVTLPQELGYETVTMLAWSMLPRHDRDELAWTQHDSMNLSGVTFALANVVGGEIDALPVRPEEHIEEFVRMNVEKEESWLDLQERTSRDPLSVRKPKDLENWVKWRNALMRLSENIEKPEPEVVAYMEGLAKTVKAYPNASWIDGEEVLRLIWSNVPAAIKHGQRPEEAAKMWGDRSRSSGLSAVVFRSAPAKHWLAKASEDVGADPLVRFFLVGGGEDDVSKPTRTAIAEWLIETRLQGVEGPRLATLAYLLAADRSPALQPLLELFLEKREGLGALIEYLASRDRGSVDLMHAAVPIVLRRAHPNTLAFLRDIFIPRFDGARVDAALAREIAVAILADPPTFLKFLRRVTPPVAGELASLVRRAVAQDAQSLRLGREVLVHFTKEEGGLENAGPLAIALAQAGEPADVWFDVLLRIARSIDAQIDSGASRDFAAMLHALSEQQLNLDGAMERFVQLVKTEQVYAHDAMRAIILLLHPVWAAGGGPFVSALIALLGRARRVTAWEDIVVAYAEEQHAKHRDHVSDLASAFWCKVDPSQVEMLAPRTGALLAVIRGGGLERLAAQWARRVGSLPRSSPIVETLLALVQQNSGSYEVERDLATRDIRHGDANPRVLNRLEAALARLHGVKGSSMFAAEVKTYLRDRGPASRAVHLLSLFASDELLPTVRLALQMDVLPDVLKDLKRGHWNAVRDDVQEQHLLGLGAVTRVAYAVGARASRGTAAQFERIWIANERKDALEALQAGRTRRGPLQWLARLGRVSDVSVLQNED